MIRPVNIYRAGLARIALAGLLALSAVIVNSRIGITAPAPAIGIPCAGCTPGMQLVFDDEFSGSAGSMPSSKYWVPEVGGSGWGNSELEYYTPSGNAALDGNGDLAITVRKTTSTNLHCWYGPCQYTSARLDSTFKFQYGKIEARIRAPVGRGIWPAFWMLGSNIQSVGWPECGEADIQETIGSLPYSQWAHVHVPGPNPKVGIGSMVRSPAPVSAGFHTYGVTWTVDKLKFYFDGAPYFTVTRSDVQAKGYAWTFDHPFYLLLDVAEGGTWPGRPSANSTFPLSMLVDYVRVYQ